MTTYHDLLASVIAALEAKDHFTADHSLRVSDMTERTCEKLGLTPKQTDVIHMAAHVHDIGKIGLPNHILSKPGSLTPDEWEKVKEHPRIGADILNKTAGLSEIAEIVLHHHERWDGKGYPDGLKREAIPLGSRIIAVCDSIDAMMSDRPYHQVFDAKACRQEILENSGKMYDPQIVSTVLKEWDSIVSPIRF